MTAVHDRSNDPLANVDPSNPYAHYRRFQLECPVCWSETEKAWVVTRYADVVDLLKRDVLVSAGRTDGTLNQIDPEERERLRALTRCFERWSLLSDPPFHTRVRAIIRDAMETVSHEQTEARIAALCRRLLDETAGQDPIDVIASYARPVPLAVITGLLGVPDEEVPMCAAWSASLARLAGARRSNTVALAAAEAVEALSRYFEALAASPAASSRGPVLASLLQSKAAGRLDDEELLATCILLLFSGHQTTTHVIGNTLLALLRSPEQRDALVSEPSLTMRAIQEGVRYDSPVQWLSRTAPREMSLRGQRIEKGDRVILLVGAANRDPDVFTQPDVFDIARNESPHLSFGLGRHTCQGTSVSLLEARIAIQAFLSARPDHTAIEDELQWLDWSAFRGLASLRVARA